LEPGDESDFWQTQLICDEIFVFPYGTAAGASVRDAVSRAYVFAVDFVLEESCHGVSSSFVKLESV
jgi:hypothetical protein